MTQLRTFHALVLAGLLAAAVSGRAAITVTGLADKAYYADTVSFTMQNDGRPRGSCWLRSRKRRRRR